MSPEQISSLIQTLVEKMGLSLDRITVSEAAGHTLFTIETKESGKLIGARGETLSALNHLVKKALEDKAPELDFHFTVDVNGYHLKRIRDLETQAKMLAERARTFKYDIEMSPMSAYERMIVHAALAGEPNVATESQGEGQTRHIVVKYIGAAASAGPETPLL